jgi:hypothetical protein
VNVGKVGRCWLFNVLVFSTMILIRAVERERERERERARERERERKKVY